MFFHVSNACVCYILCIFPICHYAGGDDSAVDDPQQHLVLTTMLTMTLVLVGMGRVCNEASRGLIFRIWPPPIHKFAVFLIRKEEQNISYLHSFYFFITAGAPVVITGVSSSHPTFCSGVHQPIPIAF